MTAYIPAKSLTSQKKRIDMLDETTILPLLKDTENERTERTVSINATEKFGQAICAFANDIMNTGNLYGKARPENFPMETDYRNPLISGVMRALGFVNRFGMGIGLVADELKENGNPPAEYILSEPSSFKVIVRSADPLSEQIRTKTEVSKNDLSGSRTNERTNPNKSIEDRLIEIVRVNSTISKTALAHELGIGRTKLYELLGTMTHRVRATGGTRHVEWTVLEE